MLAAGRPNEIGSPPPIHWWAWSRRVANELAALRGMALREAGGCLLMYVVGYCAEMAAGSAALLALVADRFLYTELDDPRRPDRRLVLRALQPVRE
jgi:hypothetical protein